MCEYLKVGQMAGVVGVMIHSTWRETCVYDHVEYDHMEVPQFQYCRAHSLATMVKVPSWKETFHYFSQVLKWVVVPSLGLFLDCLPSWSVISWLTIKITYFDMVST